MRVLEFAISWPAGYCCHLLQKLHRLLQHVSLFVDGEYRWLYPNEAFPLTWLYVNLAYKLEYACVFIHIHRVASEVKFFYQVLCHPSYICVLCVLCVCVKKFFYDLVCRSGLSTVNQKVQQVWYTTGSPVKPLSEVWLKVLCSHFIKRSFSPTAWVKVVQRSNSSSAFYWSLNILSSFWSVLIPQHSEFILISVLIPQTLWVHLAQCWSLNTLSSS